MSAHSQGGTSGITSGIERGASSTTRFNTAKVVSTASLVQISSTIRWAGQFQGGQKYLFFRHGADPH